MHMTPDSTGSAAKNYRIPVILALLFAAVFLAMPAAAHSPSDIQISYDPGSEKLSVTITHPVDDPATHYVSRVKVRQNERTISDPDYKNQPDKNTFTYTYDVKGLPGDTIWVAATCVQGGSLEKKYDIPVPTTLTTPPTPAAPVATPVPTQKSPAGILPVLGALGVGMFLVMRKE